jgi:excisionase family DNA binding protein
VTDVNDNDVLEGDRDQVLQNAEIARISLREKVALTVDETAQVLSCSRSMVYKLLHQKRLKAVKIGAGKAGGVRITWQEIYKFLKVRQPRG